MQIDQVLASRFIIDHVMMETSDPLVGHLNIKILAGIPEGLAYI